jgi:hypothetical protein
VSSVLAVEIRPTPQAAPHRVLAALIVKLKRTVNVVLVHRSALALALKAATSSLPTRHRIRVADKLVRNYLAPCASFRIASPVLLTSLPKPADVLLSRKCCSHAAEQCED